MFRPRLVVQLFPHLRSHCMRPLATRTPRNTSFVAKLDTDIYSTQYGCIPIEKLDLKFTKSRGPGGQNVNKVNSRVQLRFKVKEAEWLPEIVRDAIFEKHKNKLTKDGELLLESQASRSQENNRKVAITKLQTIIEEVYKEPGVPSEEKLKKIAELKVRAEEARRRMKFYRKQRKSEF